MISIAKQLVCVFGFSLWQISAGAQTDFMILNSSRQTTMAGMLDELSKADVVFVGEQHDHALGHQLELEILKGLRERNAKTLLSLEMFERDVQPVLDEYIGGYITEAHFLQSSRPWPNYKTDYRPMVEFCKEKSLPVVAANAPRRYVNIVSRKGQAGLEGLPKPSRAYLGRLPYSMDLPAGYDKMLSELFGDSHGQSASNSAPPPGMPTPANMKEAQALWDVTMADSIARAVREHKGWKVVQVNGAGHSDNRYGIVDRLRQVMPKLKVAVVTIRPEKSYPDIQASAQTGLADFVIYTRPETK